MSFNCTCPFTSQTISFSFSSSSVPELGGKKWENLQDITITPWSESSASIGFVFIDQKDKEVDILINNFGE